MKRLSKTELYLTIIFGCVAVFLFPKLNALYLFLALAGVVIFLIRRRAPKEDAKFLTIVIICIVATRLFLSLLVMEARGKTLTQDEGLYSKKAIIKVYGIKGVRNFEEKFAEFFDNDYDILSPGYGYSAYTYILTGFYYLFGYQIQAARLVNVFISILAFLLLFHTAKELFGPRVAMLSSAIFAFLPSIMLWSVSIGIDSTALLCVLAYLFSFIKALKKFSLPGFLAMVISLLALASFRGYAVLILILVTVFGVGCVLLKRMTGMGRLLLGLLVILSVILIINTPLIPAIDEALKKNIVMMIERQGEFAAIDDGGYLTFPAHCYENSNCNFTDLMQAYASGMSYVLFSPFPWKIGSKLQLMAYPQVVLWYFMLPCIIFGFYIGYKKQRLYSSVIFLYCLLMFSVLAFVEGNMGGLFRHKDMAVPFTLIFFAVGFRALIDSDPIKRLRA